MELSNNSFLYVCRTGGDIACVRSLLRRKPVNEEVTITAAIRGAKEDGQGNRLYCIRRYDVSRQLFYVASRELKRPKTSPTVQIRT